MQAPCLIQTMLSRYIPISGQGTIFQPEKTRILLLTPINPPHYFLLLYPEPGISALYSALRYWWNWQPTTNGPDWVEMVVVIGSVGSGKTWMCHQFEELLIASCLTPSTISGRSDIISKKKSCMRWWHHLLFSLIHCY